MRKNSRKLKRESKHQIQPMTIIEPGATLVATDGVKILADLTRWEAQLRHRRGVNPSLGLSNADWTPAQLYRHAFFGEWRAWDEHKRSLLSEVDGHLDTEDAQQPKYVSQDHFQQALDFACTTPFRLVPYFDPAPWGGQWMRRVCDLPEGPDNYGWSFDGVPEENAICFQIGHDDFTIPGQTLVIARPQHLMGEAVHARFGTDFPIRFDFLDTMGGGNLSLQVHPLTEYIQRHFGWHYTQDESYYMLDAEPGAQVYLGLKEGVDRKEMELRLREAQDEGRPFPADDFAESWPCQAHDHFLIPAGTIHCSGSGSMVLEISATPYIFTFKMWDWGRLGLDGRPRPIHLDHGLANIQWDRTTEWTKDNLINQVEEIDSGDGWIAERTGLHQREFIETVRHTGTAVMPHDTQGGVHMLNLVSGERAIVESPTGAFAPFEVSFAETFIVPAEVGAYTIRPGTPGQSISTMQASVRSGV